MLSLASVCVYVTHYVEINHEVSIMCCMIDVSDCKYEVYILVTHVS